MPRVTSGRNDSERCRRVVNDAIPEQVNSLHKRIKERCMAKSKNGVTHCSVSGHVNEVLLAVKGLLEKDGFKCKKLYATLPNEDFTVEW